MTSESVKAFARSDTSVFPKIKLNMIEENRYLGEEDLWKVVCPVVRLSQSSLDNYSRIPFKEVFFILLIESRLFYNQILAHGSSVLQPYQPYYHLRDANGTQRECPCHWKSHQNYFQTLSRSLIRWPV
jgi:hypothetical protein